MVVSTVGTATSQLVIFVGILREKILMSKKKEKEGGKIIVITKIIWLYE